MDARCLVRILGKRVGERIGMVKFYESGYYPQPHLDQGGMNDAELNAFIDRYNDKLGVPKDVADSAAMASMCGWHIPYASKATDWFKAQDLASSTKQ